MYKKIVLAYDGSDENLQALFHSGDFSFHLDSEFHLLAVIPYDSIAMGHETAYFDVVKRNDDESKLDAVLQEGLMQLAEMNVIAYGKVLKGHPVDQIVTYAKKIDAQLIMVGHKHKENWLQRWWRGSISKSLIENTSCSVLVCIIR